MNSPILSRIVTSYRQWPLIGRWIGNSKLIQERVEWIFVNDEPDDSASSGLGDCIRALGGRIVTPRFNRGRSGARNLGAAESRAPYCEHIDGDDIPLPLPQATLSLLDGSQDLVLFPVQEWSGVGELPCDAPDLALDIAPAWPDFLCGLSPVDVRPAGTLWSRQYFLGIGGYDARFESAEDFQLVLRAGWAGARVLRTSIPKQLYCLAGSNHNFSPLHIEGHRRLFEWIAAHTPAPLPESFSMWLAKESVYETLAAAKRGLCRFPSFLKFVARR